MAFKMKTKAELLGYNAEHSKQKSVVFERDLPKNVMGTIDMDGTIEINKNIKKGKLFKFNKEVDLFGYKVGDGNPSVIIAEIGINHRGNFELAKQLIKEGKVSGCDIAKLQTY